MLKLKKFLSIITMFLICAITTFAQNYKTISLNEVIKLKNEKDVIVIDSRIGDAFNGWALDGMSKGGHIEGATDFAYNWVSADAKDKEEILNKTLSSKGITKDKKVIIYDANGKDAKIVADYLSSKGIANISLFDIKEWDKANKPLISYAGYKMIAPAKIIADKIKNEKDVMVFEVAWGEEKNDEDYVKGHLPGAVHINTDEIEFPPLWSIVSDDKLIQFAKNNGITKDSKVVLYSTNPMPSYRIAAILQYLGVAEVTVLNGGLPAWKRENLALETKSNPKKPVASYGADKPLNPELIVGIDRAKAAIANNSKEILVDIRSKDEHIGVNIQSFFRDLFGYERITGRGNGRLLFKASGKNPKQMRSTLTGDVVLELSQGALLGVSLIDAFRTMPNKGSQSEYKVDVSAEQVTPFTALKGSSHLENGIALNKNLILNSSLLNLRGEGKIDLAKELIDYTMYIASGSNLSGVKQSNVPLRITGNISSPVYSLDYNALTKAGTTKEEKQKILREELIKQLNGLIK